MSEKQQTQLAEPLTLESFKSDYPEIADQVRQEGRDEAMDLFCEFADKLGGDPGLCIEQFKAGASLTDAVAALNVKLRDENEKLSSSAAKKEGVDPAVVEFGDNAAERQAEAEAGDVLDDDESLKRQFRSSPKLREEFDNDVDAYLAFKRAEANRQVKIKSNRESFDEDFQSK